MRRLLGGASGFCWVPGSTLGCMGARTLVAVGIACIDLPSFVQHLQTIHSSSNLQDISAFILSPELETILPINCCMTILLLNDLQNWRSFVEK